MRKTSRLDLIGYNVGDDIADRANIAVRIAKLTYNADGKLLEREPQRFVVQADTDIAAHMATINVHLQQMGFEPVPQADIDELRAAAESRRTPEVLEAFNARKAAREAEEAARQAEALARAKRHIDKWRFWAVLDLKGKAQQLRTVVSGISDPAKRVVVSARLEHTPTYDLDDPLFKDPDLLAGMGMTFADVEALFAEAAAL